MRCLIASLAGTREHTDLHSMRTQPRMQDNTITILVPLSVAITLSSSLSPSQRGAMHRRVDHPLAIWPTTFTHPVPTTSYATLYEACDTTPRTSTTEAMVRRIDRMHLHIDRAPCWPPFSSDSYSLCRVPTTYTTTTTTTTHTNAHHHHHRATSQRSTDSRYRCSIALSRETIYCLKRTHTNCVPSFSRHHQSTTRHQRKPLETGYPKIVDGSTNASIKHYNSAHALHRVTDKRGTTYENMCTTRPVNGALCARTCDTRNQVQHSTIRMKHENPRRKATLAAPLTASRYGSSLCRLAPRTLARWLLCDGLRKGLDDLLLLEEREPSPCWDIRRIDIYRELHCCGFAIVSCLLEGHVRLGAVIT